MVCPLGLPAGRRSVRQLQAVPNYSPTICFCPAAPKRHRDQKRPRPSGNRRLARCPRRSFLTWIKNLAPWNYSPVYILALVGTRKSPSGPDRIVAARPLRERILSSSCWLCRASSSVGAGAGAGGGGIACAFDCFGCPPIDLLQHRILSARKAGAGCPGLALD